MITDENETFEIDGIQYRLFDMRQIIRSIKKGCPLECLTLSSLQFIERSRRTEMDVANGVINEQKRIDQLERTSDD